MHLYDVFYQGNSFDSCTSLPAASPEIRYAANVNWDQHTLTPVKMSDGKWAWTGGLSKWELVSDLSSIEPESMAIVGSIRESIRAVTFRAVYAWRVKAAIELRDEDVRDAKAVVAEHPGWSLRPLEVRAQWA